MPHEIPSTAAEPTAERLQLAEHLGAAITLGDVSPAEPTPTLVRLIDDSTMVFVQCKSGRRGSHRYGRGRASEYTLRRGIDDSAFLAVFSDGRDMACPAHSGPIRWHGPAEAFAYYLRQVLDDAYPRKRKRCDDWQADLEISCRGTYHFRPPIRDKVPDLAIQHTDVAETVKESGLRLAGLRRGLIDVEKSLFGSEGDEPEPSAPSRLSPTYLSACVVARDVLQSNHATGREERIGLSRKPDETRDEVRRSATCDQAARPVDDIGNAERSRHALRSVLLAIAREYNHALARLSTAESIVGLPMLGRSLRWRLRAQAARATLTAVRMHVWRLPIGIKSPGRVVAASSRVCRGPNRADESVLLNRLRGKRIHR
ncbi:hypothetical protein IU494_30350 [Nocardia terpenica]|uniref:hypothetical protein n=1 Tax=Nocardia terpenica TaxID=455432 RepID=UPI001892F36F|nr:hypothetical protein [Nocardia terpenica]MBF6064950.1 hypothetical protein [Nocardia terpenica]MBF6115222.1 hypothetical protein [Nocardia terpenica]MBF6122544.1 hypothetical protein [Nocardia terpenica]